MVSSRSYPAQPYRTQIIWQRRFSGPLVPNRCHHQTVFPSSSVRRKRFRASVGAWRTNSRTFAWFSGVVAAVSKYQFKSGCLNGCNSENTTHRPALLAKPCPSFLAQHPVMARVPKFLHVMQPLLRYRLTVLDGTVNQEKRAARFQHPRCFVHKRGGIAEVMCGHAACHKFEYAVGVRKQFGSMLPCLDTKPTFARGGGGAFQHRGRNISKRDVPAGARQETVPYAPRRWRHPARDPVSARVTAPERPLRPPRPTKYGLCHNGRSADQTAVAPCVGWHSNRSYS